MVAVEFGERFLFGLDSRDARAYGVAMATLIAHGASRNEARKWSAAKRK
jgi:hypothetical protein